jgi:hypothetical protein
MATKADFTAEEQITFKHAPQLAALYVLTASPSGPVGMGKELYAMAAAVEALKQDAGAPQTLKELFAGDAGDPQAQITFNLGDKEAAQRAAFLTELKASVALIDARLGGDAAAFKRWIYGIAEKVAGAAKEGGVLGIGGTPLSAAEQAALGELKGALGL